MLNYNFLYPDTDGVLGINQSNLPQNQALKSAFGIKGAKFAERFPNRQVFCLDYHRFYADMELGIYANKIRKFTYCKECRITHYHPSFYPNLYDYTHTSVRKWLPTDRAMFSKRQRKGLLWGDSFQLLTGE